MFQRSNTINKYSYREYNLRVAKLILTFVTINDTEFGTDYVDQKP